METKNSKNKNEFHAVEFMREVRAELTQEFLQNKQKYLDHLHQVMTEFKAKNVTANR